MTSSNDLDINKQEEYKIWLINHLAEYLNTSPNQIKSDEPFESFGLSSKEMVMISGDLEEHFDVRLEPTIVYQYSTIDALAIFLSGEEKEDQSVEKPETSFLQKEPIAVIGIGCRFPGGNSPEKYWDILNKGIDTINEVPKERWNNEDYYDPELKTPGTIVTNWGGFIRDVDSFDNELFKISPREASRIDPQQRILLEVTREALENAGLNPDKISGSLTGVFIGISTNDYSSFQFSEPSLVDAYAGTGNAHSIAANRISYFFDLQGPSYAVDTACSSSLVSVHLAIQSLRSGESDLALAGGVNLLLTPKLTIAFSHARMLAPDGRCKTFDSSADGYVRGEGCGIVVLKRLTDAIKDKDNIYGLIRGSAINHDGRSNGLTAPNGLSQQVVIKKALINAGVTPDQINYIEAHGTGTHLGDPIEFNALKSVFDKTHNQNNKLALGSVKTNIGHLEAAAGVAGLIKVLLALNNKTIPPHLHLKELNPQIKIDGSSMFIPTAPIEWPANQDGSRFAGVSSFGFGGTNAHLIVESWKYEIEDEAQSKTKFVGKNQDFHIFTLSARNETILKKFADRYINYFQSPVGRESLIADVCYSANSGRQDLDSRLAVFGKDSDDLSKNLTAFLNGKSTSGFIQQTVEPGKSQKIAFLFSGQGSQYPGMGRELYDVVPTFRRILDECNEISKQLLPKPLLSVIFDENQESDLINQTLYTQPALFVLEYGIASLLKEWGIEPDILLGHSIGEYSATCFAESYTLEEGLKLVVQRGRLMQSLPKNGSMAAVFTDISNLNEKIKDFKDQVSIATINGPTNLVISGLSSTITEIISSLESEGIECRLLDVSHAFHSPLMDPILEEFQSVAGSIEYQPLKYPIASNLTGKIISSGVTLEKDYWVKHVRQPVLFSTGMELLGKESVTTFIEIGPTPVLLGMAKRYLKNPELQWLPSLRKGKSDQRIISNLIGSLYTNGTEINWEGYYQSGNYKKVPLPTYPYEHKRFWFDINSKLKSGIKAFSSEDNEIGNWLYNLVWRQSDNLPSSESKGRGPKTTVIFSDQNRLGDLFKDKVQEQGSTSVIVYPGEEFNKISNSEYYVNPTEKSDFETLFKELEVDGFLRIFHLWSLNSTFLTQKNLPSLQDDINLSCIPTLFLIQVIEDLGLLKSSDIAAWFFTQGAQPVKGDENPISITQAPLWSFVQSIAFEYPEIDLRIVDLDPINPTEGFNRVWDAINNPDKENKIAYRTGLRYIQRLEKYKIGEPIGGKISCDPDMSYLITGGTGDLGLSIARRLIERGARTLILASRTEIPVPFDSHISNLDNATSEKVLAIKELMDLGAEIHTISLDVADEDQMSEFLGSWQNNYPPLKGIIHLAGIVKPLTIHQLSAENLDSVMRSKVFGTWLLHDLTDWAELDFFVLFSSAASVLNPPLLGSYAAANAFLNAVAQYRSKLGLKTLSIDWGFWSGKGMAVQYTGSANRTLVPKGMKSIPTEKGLDILEYLMKQDFTRISVIPADWQEFARSDPRIRRMPLLSDLVGEVQSDFTLTDESSTGTKSFTEDQRDEININRILELPREERIDYLTEYINSIVSKALLMEVDEIDPGQNLMELGIDSLMVMELTASLERDFQITVYPREVFERPNIQELVIYLEGELIRLKQENLPELEKLLKPSQLTGTLRRTNSFGLPTDILNYHHPEKNQSPIVFILSSPRAGSTLLRVMLTGHPDLFCPPELHLLPFEDMRTRNEMLGGSYLDEGLTRSIMEIKGIDLATANELIGGWIDQGNPIEEIYGNIQQNVNPQILIDKSPSYALSMDVLERAEQMFENPKYILLSRHPYSVMDSFEKNRFDKLLGYETENPLSLAEDIWATMNSNVLDFFDGLPNSRFTIVKYERLVKESKKVMMEVCNFLGVGYNEALLKPYENGRMTDGIHHESKSIGDPNFLKHQIIDESLGDVWKHVKFRVRLGGFARRVSRELGYELIDIAPRETMDPLKANTADSPSKYQGIKPLSRERRRMNSSDHKPSEITDSLKDEIFGKDD